MVFDGNLTDIFSAIKYILTFLFNNIIEDYSPKKIEIKRNKSKKLLPSQQGKTTKRSHEYYKYLSEDKKNFKKLKLNYSNIRNEIIADADKEEKKSN